jgi:hypothetical protein
MKTLLITAEAKMPAGLRDLVLRGSTSLLERRAAELEDARMPDVDRIVFWTDVPDAAVEALAERYARTEAAERREVLVFVTGEQASASAPRALSANERYVWPRDEDRLQMAFLTGA